MASVSNHRGYTITLKIVVSAGILALIVSKTDLAASAERVGNLFQLQGATGIMIIYLQSLIVALRWSYILNIRGEAIPVSHLFRINLEGTFFNQALPSTLGGDVIRIQRLVKLGVKATTATSATLLDRVSGLIGLTVLFLAIVAFARQKIPLFEIEFAIAPLVTIGLVSLGVIAIALRFAKNTMVAKAMHFFAELKTLSQSLLTDKKSIIFLVVVSIGVHLCSVAAVYFFGRALDSDISFLAIFFTVPIVSVLTMIPISVGGWGIREMIFIFTLSGFGVAAEDSFALSVAYGVCLIVASLVGGILWLLPLNRLHSKS
jgi:uncharacterized protein (TIRG00374 family)